MKRHLASLTFCAVVAFAGDASAQTTHWGKTGYLSFNTLYQSTPINFETNSKVDVYQEQGDFRTEHRGKPGPLFDITAGAGIKGNLGVGYATSYRRQTDHSRISGAVPHPFYFNQARAVSGVGSLKREDLAFHLAAIWMMPVSERLQVSLFGGPTYFRVTQDMVGTVELNEVFPFDQPEYKGITASSQRGSRVGYNAGADVSMFFTRRLGVGGLVRYSQGNVEMSVPGGTTKQSIKAGGLQTGAGLRVRF
jgi:Outer membrane protein beta-barrel domain